MKGKKLGAQDRISKLEIDSIERRKVFKELCNHLSQGLSLDCFALLSANTIRRYLKTYPEEFCEEELELSLRQGRDWWENIGKSQASGNCLGNSRTWYYNMSNRYGWRDKVDIEAEHKGQLSVSIVNYASLKGSSDTED